MMQTGFQISGEDMEQLGVIIYHSIKSAYKVDGIVGGRCKMQGQMGAHPFLALTALLPYQKKGKRLRPTDIAKFPWDTLTIKQLRMISKESVPCSGRINAFNYHRRHHPCGKGYDR